MTEAALDALTSSTLKHLREFWWNDEFTVFLRDTLKPRPGNRILDVGCGEGLAEIAIGRLHLSQIRLFGVDQLLNRVVVAKYATASHNQHVGLAAADACCLPFTDAVFDSTYCVAVLQHVPALAETIAEFARVTRTHGRVVIVEPDNSARYWYSAVPSGTAVYAARTRFFAAIAEAAGDRTAGDVGPRVATLMEQHKIEPLSVRLFPVSQTHIGAPSAATWTERIRRIQRHIDDSNADAVRAAGREYLDALAAYAKEAEAAGPAFVEVQNTLLFATVGQKN
jgi:ubiquinone/menaquinone biosynthesis C-methylase UbiE